MGCRHIYALSAICSSHGRVLMLGPDSRGGIAVRDVGPKFFELWSFGIRL